MYDHKQNFNCNLIILSKTSLKNFQPSRVSQGLKCYANAMQVLCKCYASAMQVQCKCYAMLQVLEKVRQNNIGDLKKSELSFTHAKKSILIAYSFVVWVQKWGKIRTCTLMETYLHNSFKFHIRLFLHHWQPHFRFSSH